MKIALGYHIQRGAWGGGNQFAKSVVRVLEGAGHKVVYSLDEEDIDIILLTETRRRSPSAAFTAAKVIRYIIFKNTNALVIQRINECDERKNSSYMNSLLKRANYIADHTVFVGSWLKDLPLWREGSHSVILNGADQSIFKASGRSYWDRTQPMQLVTHHWGAHWMKGFDVYLHIDRLLSKKRWREKIDFTYIGNLPRDITFKNVRHISPKSGAELAMELAKNHAYLTASMNEPGPMHPVEAALCGLPLIYRSSGSLPEYCNGYGIEYNGPDDVEAAIDRMLVEYEIWSDAVKSYPNTADRMGQGYVKMFEELLLNRTKIVSRRHVWREPLTVLLNHLSVR